MLAAASTSVPLWLYIAVPLVGGIIGVIPGWKGLDRRRKREARMERTADAVLGEEADPNIGRYTRTEGLVDVVPEIAKAIGNSNGKSIMEHVQAIEANQNRFAADMGRFAAWQRKVEERLSRVEKR